jgi:hypothetical protein
MPRLACWTCGRQIYTVAPLEALFAEERRCPRCGAFLRPERREGERRQANRRVNPPNDPGPPKSVKGKDAKAKSSEHAATGPEGGERRVSDRRSGQRRRDWNERPRNPSSGSAGWHD